MDGIEVCTRKNRPDLYEMLKDLIAKHHAHLCEADIVICFNFNWKPDSDGHLKLVEVTRASAVTQCLSAIRVDLIITLNQQHFEKMDDTQKRACLDEALCRCKERQDQSGRTIGYRVSKIDFCGMMENIKRFGPWQTTLKTVQRLLNAEEEPGLFDAVSEEIADAEYELSESATIPMLPEGQSS
ncbi:putative metallopeptidase [Tuwongella immobilis]|uniref:Putative phage metallopeptidase domain-containing protein n=1 Tax=Tuwongella immobilis TaxID=692036 RepID=A0A6C2YL42_9BACT|nr:putative metallopeptidase [Tuwongella immobilis]VIP02146.1 Uncharacterized protein OS=Thermosinus carboxydivorans Nor1 GN=TcarDRAFT_1305 PE=4 SV=1 [Tuwongella immobilis]VTS00525.1 Uncharacterized protein OS=Thermosinus carboxydivorans Nor1 GN=TcarDRAFT_1305 PE=4 SV=1 [Tuwongella immobilis]